MRTCDWTLQQHSVGDLVLLQMAPHRLGLFSRRTATLLLKSLLSPRVDYICMCCLLQYINHRNNEMMERDGLAPFSVTTSRTPVLEHGNAVPEE